jgi:hypothetical protein
MTLNIAQGKFSAKLVALSAISLLAISTPLFAGPVDLSERSDTDIKQDATRKPA